MLGFIAAFVVKLPVVPFHSWLPDTYTEAPLEGTVILSGLLSKTAAYGLLRFVLPLFHESVVEIAPIAMALGVAGIIYGAVLAFGQKDIKRLIAYTSVSHLGFVFVGIFSLSQLAIQGAVLQMISHGVATSGLFITAAFIEERLATRNLDRMGGLFAVVPRLGGAGIVFALIALGVPGSGNFISEILIVVGTFKANVVIAILAATGLVFSVIYALHVIQKSFHGPLLADGSATDAEGAGAATDGTVAAALTDISLGQTLMALLMILVVFWIGIYPQPLFQAVSHFVQALQGGLS